MATGHEVVWSRLLAYPVGNTSWGVGLVLFGFMVGMGVGALVAARAPSTRRVRIAYVGCELLIAVGGILVLCWVRAPLVSLMVTSNAGMMANVVDIGLGLALVALPAAGMGGTFPLLLRALAPAGATEGLVGSIYLAGIVGGFLGILAVGFWFVPLFGADIVGIGLCVGNVGVAVAAIAVLPRAPGAGRTRGTSKRTFDRGLHNSTALFACAGFFGVGCQVVWHRCLLAYAGVSIFTFAAITATYLLGQAVGMMFTRWVSHERRIASACYAIMFAPVVATLSLLAAVSVGGPLTASRDAAPLWLASIFAVVGVGVLPTAVLLGIGQRLVLEHVDTMRNDAGRRGGTVVGIGTALSGVGAIAATWLLFPVLGARWTLLILAAPGIVIAIHLLGARLPLLAAVGLAAVSAVVTRGPVWFLGPSLEDSEILYAEHNSQDTVAVIVDSLPSEPRVRHLVSNGVSYSGDSFFAQRYMRLLGHLPALISKDQERALVVCVGTGTTLHALSSHPFRHLDAVDISPSIPQTLRWFEHVNGGIDEDSRTSLRVDDGVRWLRLTRDRYDLITFEPPPPRAPGGSSLYTTEAYRGARDRLSAGGVVAQWLPLHGLDASEARALLRTFFDVFPFGALYVVERNEAILLGGMSDLDFERSRPGRLNDAFVQSDLAEIGFRDADPVATTFAVSASGIRALVSERNDRRLVRFAWPMPELAPLVEGSRPEALDRFLDAVAHTRRGACATNVWCTIAPSFVRIREGRGSSADRELVQTRLVQLLRDRPDDPYLSFVFGYGPLLEGRLTRIASELSESELSAAQASIERQRGIARRLISEAPIR